jgi:excisionase family DNA binding protein
MLTTSFNPGHQPPTTIPDGAEFLTPFFNEIVRRVDRRVDEAVARALAQKASEAAETEKNAELLNDRQAAELLGVKPKTVHSWKQKGILPSYRLGGRIFYKRGEVLAALESNTQPDGRRKYARRSTTPKSR